MATKKKTKKRTTKWLTRKRTKRVVWKVFPKKVDYGCDRCGERAVYFRASAKNPAFRCALHTPSPSRRRRRPIGRRRGPRKHR